MKLLDIFKKYDRIIFDMDGVITTEQQYWTSAALTVYEWLNSKEYYGKKTLSLQGVYENRMKIREEIFQNDRTISTLKNIGVNSNWDLAYVVIALALINNTRDFSFVLSKAKELSDNIIDNYDEIGEKLTKITGVPSKRNEKLWQDIVATFQKWYLGENNIDGLLKGEAPLIERDKMIDVLSSLKNAGKRLSVATGRLYSELELPLKNFGVYDLFAEDGFITYDYIIKSEAELNQNLTKPHPYMFLKSMLGSEYSDKKIVYGEFDKDLIKRTLVVGDAGADMFAAKAMGADFLAVLTGVKGEKGRSFFEENEAEYILPSIACFLE